MSRSPAILGVNSKRRVPHEFDRIARGCDTLSALKPGSQEHLEWSARRLQLAEGDEVLDLCCGTGLSTWALKRAQPAARLTGLDASEGMLQLAASKRELADARWQLQGRLWRAGFTDVRVEPMDGWQRGVVHSFLARRLQ